jgi:hypothetical protein
MPLCKQNTLVNVPENTWQTNTVGKDLKKYPGKKPKIHFAKSIYSAKPERHVATAVPSDVATLVKSPPPFPLFFVFSILLYNSL